MSVSLLWLGMALLALELGALLFRVSMERSNPYIAAYRSGLPLPANGATAVRTEADGYFPEEIGGWSPPENMSNNYPLLHKFPKIEESVSESAATNDNLLKSEFAALTDKEKEVYAFTQGMFILALDQNFSLQEVYGAYKVLFEGFQKYATFPVMRSSGAWDDICTGLQVAEKNQQAYHVQTTFPTMVQRFFPIEAICLPPAVMSGGDFRRYVIYKAHPELLADTLRKQMPEDTRWDIPFYRYKPASDNPSFSTNSFGLRSAEITIPKQEDEFRILCIGGSTTEEGASNETTYPSLMEGCLAQAFPDRKIEVVNAGISGISSDWHLLRINDYLKWEPDLVIIHVGVNDLWRQYNLKWAVNMLADYSHFARLLFSHVGLRGAGSIGNTGLCLEIMTMYFQQSGAAVAFASIAHPNTELISKAEKQYYNYQAWNKWQLPAFSFDQYADDIESSNRMLNEISKKHNTFYIPVAESIKGTTSIFWDFCHMNPEGIAMKAEIMCDFVAEILKTHLSKRQYPIP